MKISEFKNIKKSDLVTHKKYGLCEVVDFVVWWGAPKDPILMPQTKEGKELLLQHFGMKDTPICETNKNLIESRKISIDTSIENDINKFIEYDTRERQVRFWGSDHTIRPQLVEEIEGDGLQVVWLQSIDHRPDYYVLRIDSSHDFDSDDFDEEILLKMVENEFCKADDLDFDGNLRVPIEEAFTLNDLCFPILSWGGGSWGTYGNFKDVDYCKLLNDILMSFERFIECESMNSIDLTIESHLKLPEAIHYTLMRKIKEANNIEIKDNNDYWYMPWHIEEKDYPDLSRKEFLKLWYKPRIEAIQKTIEFLK
jgi:hypothetical protein